MNRPPPPPRPASGRGDDAGKPLEPVSSRTVFRWGMAGAFGVLVVVLAIAAVYTVRDLLVQVSIAIFVAVSLDPGVRWLIRRGVRRGHAVFIVILFILLLIAGLLWTVIPPLVSQANALTSDFPGYLDRIRKNSPSLSRLESGLGLRSRVDALAQQLPPRLASEAFAFGRRFLGALVSVLLIIVLTIYLMLDLPRLRRGLVRLFPKRHRAGVAGIVNTVVDKVGSYMIGNLLISLIAGVAALIAFSALRLPFALPLAVLVAVTDLIPLIGATIGAVVTVIVAAATTELWPTTVLVGAFFVLYQQLENYIIAPRVLRNTVDIPMIAVLFAALVGGSLIGIVGVLVAIPVAAVVKVIVGERIRIRDENAERDEGGD